MKGKPVCTITTAEIHDGEWNFANNIDGTNLKIIPINDANITPSDILCEYFAKLRKGMMDGCILPITTATGYIEK